MIPIPQSEQVWAYLINLFPSESLAGWLASCLLWSVSKLIRIVRSPRLRLWMRPKDEDALTAGVLSTPLQFLTLDKGFLRGAWFLGSAAHLIPICDIYICIFSIEFLVISTRKRVGFLVGACPCDLAALQLRFMIAWICMGFIWFWSSSITQTLLVLFCVA